MVYIGRLYAMLGIGYRALWAYINRSDDGISKKRKFLMDYIMMEFPFLD